MFNKKNDLFEEKYETLKKEFEEFKKNVIREKSELPMFVDFEKMKVVSIERMIHENGIPVTIMGYISPSCAQLQEWQLYCSDANHIMMVDQFKKYIYGK